MWLWLLRKNNMTPHFTKFMKILPSVYAVLSDSQAAAEIRTQVPAFLMRSCYGRSGDMVTDYRHVCSCFLLFSLKHHLVRLVTFLVPLAWRAGLVHALLMVMLVNGSECDSNLDLLTWSPALSPIAPQALFLMPHLWTQRQCRCCVRTWRHAARCLPRDSASSSVHEAQVPLGTAVRLELTH